MANQLNGCSHFFVFVICYLVFFLKSLLWPIYCVLSLWGKIMIPMYRLWLHSLFGLYGPWCPLSPQNAVKLNHSPTHCPFWRCGSNSKSIISESYTLSSWALLLVVDIQQKQKACYADCFFNTKSLNAVNIGVKAVRMMIMLIQY